MKPCLTHEIVISKNANLKEYLVNYNINKVTDIQSNLLEGKLSVYELGQALKI